MRCVDRNAVRIDNDDDTTRAQGDSNMKNNTWLTDKYVAHRGLFDNITLPENSLPAFENAVKNNFAIEMDVQMTKDGVLVVFHDDEMSRMTSLKGDIREKSYDEIKDACLLGTQHKIPTFEQFLECINGRTQLVIEIKTHKNIGTVEQKVLDVLSGYTGEYCIESFNPLIVRWFKVHAPNIVRGQLSYDFKDAPFGRLKKRMLSNLWLCKWNGSQFIAFDEQSVAENKAVARYRKKIPVICWTVKSQQRLDFLEQYCDNVIFDSFLPERRDLGN